MGGNDGGAVYVFDAGITGGVRPISGQERRRRRANQRRSAPLLGVALLLLGLGLVVASEWLRTAGPVAAPRETQQSQTNF